jgi:hypothetical protein
MDFANGCGMIAPTVVALREEGDGIDRSRFQRFLPSFFVKFFADPRDVG